MCLKLCLINQSSSCAPSLVNRYIQIRVCKHGCDVHVCVLQIYKNTNDSWEVKPLFAFLYSFILTLRRMGRRRDSSRKPRLCLAFPKLFQIPPPPLLVFTWDYVNARAAPVALSLSVLVNVSFDRYYKLKTQCLKEFSDNLNLNKWCSQNNKIIVKLFDTSFALLSF